MRAAGAALIALFIPFEQAGAQVIEPEACILDTLKGGAAKEAVPTIRVNCIRQYIRSVQGSAANLGPEPFKGSSLAHYPQMPAISTAIPEKIVIQLKNDSSMRVIMADVVLVNKKTKVKHQFRAMADTPIDPAMVDTMTAQINLSIKDFDEWTWNFLNVWGVPLKTN